MVVGSLQAVSMYEWHVLAVLLSIGREQGDDGSRGRRGGGGMEGGQEEMAMGGSMRGGGGRGHGGTGRAYKERDHLN